LSLDWPFSPRRATGEVSRTQGAAELASYQLYTRQTTDKIDFVHK
jgi:hypothetical protein